MDKANENRDDPVGDALRAGQLPTVDAETRELHERVMSLLKANHSCINGLLFTREINRDRETELEAEQEKNLKTRRHILSEPNERVRNEIYIQKDIFRRLTEELLATPDNGPGE